MTYKHQTDPDHYRRGLGLYVSFLQGDPQMLAVDPAAGDVLVYGEREITLIKAEPDGTTRRIELQKHALAATREQIIDIKYKSTPVATVNVGVVLPGLPEPVIKKRRGRPRKMNATLDYKRDDATPEDEAGVQRARDLVTRVIQTGRT